VQEEFKMKLSILKRFLSCWLLIVAILSAASLESAVRQEQDPRVDSVDKLFAELNNTESPGIAILAVRDGEVLLRRCYGMANLEHKVPITPETVFDIASVSKQFCGMAVSMLIEQGKITLQDDIRKYIPELPDFSHTITVDHLVHHVSGLRDWPATLALAGWRMDDVISFDQILTMAFNQQDLNFNPGLEQLAELTGKYKSEELETFYSITLEDGKLVAKHRRHGTINLTYAYKDDFRGGVWFMRSVEFYRNEAGKVAGFKVTQSRSRNQRFIKQR
jgi:CubicO group peptidase (beta-lactamase class C family)